MTTSATIYPPADTKAQWYQDNYPGAAMDPDKGVIHTTEGYTWPGYENGATAPNLTALPIFDSQGRYQRLAWRQHFPADRSSRALKNLAGGVETNTDDALQVELVGTCDKRTSESWRRNGIRHIYWPDAPRAALEDLAEFVAWAHEALGIPLRGAPRWLAYPASYASSGGVRFSGTTWRDFSGWCGHQHVPENVHGDPGNIDWLAIQSAAEGLTMPPLVLDVSVLVAAFRGYLDAKRQPKHTRTQVRRLQRALNQTTGASLVTDGTLDRGTIAAWREHERIHGGRGRDTVPDFASLSALASPRFDVRK